jgi:hypothetical protein
MDVLCSARLLKSGHTEKPVDPQDIATLMDRSVDDFLELTFELDYVTGCHPSVTGLHARSDGQMCGVWRGNQ